MSRSSTTGDEAGIGDGSGCEPGGCTGSVFGFPLPEVGSTVGCELFEGEGCTVGCGLAGDDGCIVGCEPTDASGCVVET